MILYQGIAVAAFATVAMLAAHVSGAYSYQPGSEMHLRNGTKRLRD